MKDEFFSNWMQADFSCSLCHAHFGSASMLSFLVLRRNARRLLTVLAACGIALLASSVLARAATPPDEAAHQAKWQVKRADWGSNNHRIDVTLRLWQVLYTSANGDVPVDSVTFGFDPAVGQSKTLRVFAANDEGGAQTLTFKDGDALHSREFDTGASTGRYPGFPHAFTPPHFATAYAAEQRPTNSPRLEIIAAYYGSGALYNDVTGRLQSMVQNGRLVVDVTNDNMGGDPAFDSHKVLSVIFRVNGGPESSTTVLQGETLRLPTEASPRNEPPAENPGSEKSGANTSASVSAALVQ